MIEPFGEHDVLLMNILCAPVFAAIYLSLPTEYRLTPAKNTFAFSETEEYELLVSGKYTMQELTDFYEYSMNENFVIKLYLKRSCFSKGYQNIAMSFLLEKEHSQVVQKSVTVIMIRNRNKIYI